MKILVAKTAGYCMGVRRAVDIAVDTASQGQGIYSLGPLIHNNQTLEMLKDRGVEILQSDDIAPRQSTILIRAHGIPPEIQKRYQSGGHKIIDGTCPKVKTVHKVIQKYRGLGYQIVITGDEGHAEVIGLLGYAGEDGHLIQTPGDVSRLDSWEKVCLVSQTTFDRRLFEKIAERMKQRFSGKELIVKKTICSATDRRQEETEELSKRVDAMIVVGGKHSANTLRLAEISRQNTRVIQHVETEKEIDWDAVAGCRTVGITAGASTPNWMIKRIIEHLMFLEQTKSKNLKSTLRHALDTVANLNLFVAAGAVAMYYTSVVFQGLDFSWTGALLVFLYMLSMYLWNSLTSLHATQHLGISRYLFYKAHKWGLYSLALASIGFMLGISYMQHNALFLLMLVATAAGSIYHFTIVPRSLRWLLRYSTLKDIPTSRDLFVALAWAVLLTFIPQARSQEFTLSASVISFFIWMFFLSYLRALRFDLRDIEGDRIMGRETLVTVIGERRVRRISSAGLVIASAG
ncbi:MAG: 4-hydroxy-3-methylbut-2-enyl diphosphate reductase, partial [Chitinivibrionales bacterium]